VFGHYRIRLIQSFWITSQQIESGRRVLIRYIRRTGKLWIRIFPDKPITARPAETRIGSGKGTCAYWVAVVRPGIIIFEFTGITKRIGIQATKVVGSKFSAGVCLVTKKLNLYD
jgi:large subunit ribosomal protein L16